MKSVYATTFNGEDVEVHFAEIKDVDYTVILIKEPNDGKNICLPSVYLKDATRDKDEIFLRDTKQQCHGVIDMLEREELIERTGDLIETNDNDYATVCRLTDKAKEVIGGYIVEDRDEPDEIPDAEFD